MERQNIVHTAENCLEDDGYGTKEWQNAIQEESLQQCRM
jgi:hypothetical protein